MVVTVKQESGRGPAELIEVNASKFARLIDTRRAAAAPAAVLARPLVHLRKSVVRAHKCTRFVRGYITKKFTCLCTRVGTAYIIVLNNKLMNASLLDAWKCA